MTKKTSIFSIAKTLQEHDLFAFRHQMLKDLFDLDSDQAARLLGRMESEGLVARPERGKYILLGLTPEKTLSNHLFIGSHLVTPGYVSFWSALHFYGFTEQVPQTVFISTTRKKSALTFRGTVYEFITLKPNHFFGYRGEIQAGLPVLIADEAKTIVDSLQRPQYAGGVAEVAKALRNALPQMDVDRLVRYANRMGNRSLCSRLGYLLDQLDVTVEGLDISRGPVKLDPARARGGDFHPDWQLYANLSTESLFPEGVG